MSTPERGVRMETGSPSQGNSVGKALRAQLGREKPILLFCRNVVGRAERGEPAEPPAAVLPLLDPPPRPCPNSAATAAPSSPRHIGKDPDVLAVSVTRSYFRPKCIRLQGKKKKEAAVGCTS